MKVKHIIATSMLAATLVVSSVPVMAETVPMELTVSAYAANDSNFTVGDFTYRPTSDKSATLLKYNGIDYDVKIPSTVKNGKNTYTVTAIGDSAFKGNGSIGSVIIPDTVATIGTDAFSGCAILSSLTLPKNLTTIPGALCQNDTALTSIVIPNKVVTIGPRAFSGCTALSDVKMSSSVTSIDSYVFDSTAITELYLPKSLKVLSAASVHGVNQVLYEGTEASWNKLKIDNCAFSWSGGDHRVSFNQKFGSHTDYAQPKLSNVKATAASKSTITVSWTKATTKAVDSFRIEVYKGKTLVETIVVENTGSVTKKTISDLAKGTKYTINVVAVKGITESDTVTKTATTKSK